MSAHVSNSTAALVANASDSLHGRSTVEFALTSCESYGSEHERATDLHRSLHHYPTHKFIETMQIEHTDLAYIYNASESVIDRPLHQNRHDHIGLPYDYKCD